MFFIDLYIIIYPRLELVFDSKRVGLVNWVGNDYTLQKTNLTGLSKKTRVTSYLGTDI